MNPNLLYIHNQNIQPVASGGLNTTLLQVFSMCKAFSKAGLNVKLAMQGDNNFYNNLNDFVKKSFKEELPFEVLYWTKAHNNGFINRLIVKKRIIKLARKYNPDIIFTREPIILDSLVGLKKPIIFESHNNKLHTRYRLIHKYLMNKVVKAAKSNNFKCLFSISKSLSIYWKQKGISENKLFSWHDGFDTLLFKEHLTKEETRKTLNLPQEKKIITYTGGLYPDREIEKIIDLAKVFSDKIFLLIGGPEKNRQFYASMAQKNNVENIIFLGFVKHNLIPEYLYASDVLLALWSSKVPTINYCSPLKLFEYMAAGRVILAHSFPTIKEVLTDDVDAIFCEPDNFNSMKQGLSKAIDASTSNKHGLNARKNALENYSWNTRVSKLLGFINSN